MLVFAAVCVRFTLLNDKDVGQVDNNKSRIFVHIVLY